MRYPLLSILLRFLQLFWKQNSFDNKWITNRRENSTKIYTTFSYFFSVINTVLFLWVFCLTTAFSNCNTLCSWWPIFYQQYTLSIDVYFPWFSSRWVMEIVLDILDLPNFVPSFLTGPIFWIPYRQCHGWFLLDPRIWN